MNGDPRDSIATTWLQNDIGDDNASRGGDRVWFARSAQNGNFGFAGTFTAKCPGLSVMR